MSALRSKFGIAVSVTVCLLIGSLQSFLYFLDAYPDCLKDLTINQEFGYIGNKVSQYRYAGAGLDEMKKSSVIFMGVGKSIDRRLVQSLLRDLQRLSQNFASSRAIFVIDSTSLSMQEVFYSWAKESPNNRTILIAIAPQREEKGIFPKSENTSFPREGKISQARNLALGEYRKGLPSDYIINVDLDIIGWDMGGVYDSFGQSSEWDVVCANGVILHGIYRDVYALRAPGIETNHHLSGDDHAQFNITHVERVDNHERLVKSKRKIARIFDGRGLALSNGLHDSPDLVKLDSCFGGMAIYKTAATQDCVYSHRHPGNYVVDCEHVLFHKCMAEKHNARVVSNRNMKVWYGHTSLASLNYQKSFRSLFST